MPKKYKYILLFYGSIKPNGPYSLHCLPSLSNFTLKRGPEAQFEDSRIHNSIKAKQFRPFIITFYQLANYFQVGFFISLSLCDPNLI